MPGYLIERWDVACTLLELACKASYVGVLVMSLGVLAARHDDEGLLEPFRKGLRRFVIASVLLSLLWFVFPNAKEADTLHCMDQPEDFYTVPDSMAQFMRNTVYHVLTNNNR